MARALCARPRRACVAPAPHREVGSPPRSGRTAPGRGGLGGAAPPRNGPAWGAEVVSSNIVGYNKVTLNYEFSMLGANFTTVGAANGKTKISQIIPDANVTGIDWAGDWDWGASLQIWNGSDYVGGVYYWTGEVPVAAQEEVKEELELDEDFVYNNIWVDSDMKPANVQIPIGTGFWIQDNGATGASKISFSAP